MTHLAYQHFAGGDDIPQDYKKALELFLEIVSISNDVITQYNIGYMYTHGIAVRQDFTKSYSWYLKAAEQDMSSAQSNLVNQIYFGLGFERDYQKLFEWY